MALIGYAEADFYSMRTKGHYYVDRTSFIAELENLGNRNLMFARPRRFGNKTGEKYVAKIANEAREQLKNYLQTDDAKRLPNLKRGCSF
jgi:hypothetical protein